MTTSKDETKGALSELQANRSLSTQDPCLEPGSRGLILNGH